MRTFFSLLLLCLSAAAAQAQEVYDFVLENAARVANSPGSSFAQAKIAQFKHTALVYLRAKAEETMPQVSGDFLDEQASCMSEFIALFVQDARKSKSRTDEERRGRIQLFTDASLSNPLFRDADTRTVHAFIDDGSDIMPFSLDTDWVKAYAAAKAIAGK